jgi:hypothetical protein
MVREPGNPLSVEDLAGEEIVGMMNACHTYDRTRGTLRDVCEPRHSRCDAGRHGPRQARRYRQASSDERKTNTAAGRR